MGLEAEPYKCLPNVELSLSVHSAIFLSQLA